MAAARALVTGGGGFIGSHAVDRLTGLGHHVAVVDDLRSGRLANLPAGATLYDIDIASPDLDDVIAHERPEYVFHFAGQISVQRSMQDPVLDAETNVRGSLNLLQNCVKYGVGKVVYTSSGGAIYGDPVYLPCDEAHPVRPLSHYGVSKYAVEKYLYVYGESAGLDYTVLRLGNVYGPRQDPQGEAGVVAIFSQAMLEGRPVTIFGAGEQERDFVHVYDVAEAAVMAMEKGSGKSFNIGAGLGSSINDIFRLLKRLTDYGGDAIYGPARTGEVFKIFLDISAARSGLGWEPGFSLEDGLRNTVDWFRSPDAY